MRCLPAGAGQPSVLVLDVGMHHLCRLLRLRHASHVQQSCTTFRTFPPCKALRSSGQLDSFTDESNGRLTQNGNVFIGANKPLHAVSGNRNQSALQRPFPSSPHNPIPSSET